MLNNMQKNLENRFGMYVGKYKEVRAAYVNKREHDVFVFDDADIDKINHHYLFGFYKEKNKPLVLSCSNIEDMKFMIDKCQTEIYELPEPGIEDIKRFIYKKRINRW